MFGNINVIGELLISGHFNSNLRLLRAVLGHGVKTGISEIESDAELGVRPS